MGSEMCIRDREIDVEHVLRIKRHLNELLAQNTGKPVEQVAADTERDHWLTAEEAKEYGLIDQVYYQR